MQARCVEALWQPFEDQGWVRLAAGDAWEEPGLVFSSAIGIPLDAAKVRRAFRQALKDVDGVNPDDRHTKLWRSSRGVHRRRSPGSSGTLGQQ